MENGSSLKVLLVADGSGGHLIPALQVASTLARQGARIKVWYAQHRQVAPLTDALTQGAPADVIDVDAIPVTAPASLLERLWQCGRLWHRAQQCFDTFAPDVVVGFGGWVSAPVVLAARRRRIGCLVHEQNVVMGLANQWLSPWVNRVALSFGETRANHGNGRSVMTGLPIRQGIGRWTRAQAAEWFGLQAQRPTLLVLGGSQGSRAMNRLVSNIVGRLSESERHSWQFVHLTGPSDEAMVRNAYTQHGVTAWVAPFLVEMGLAYAHADLVMARAGASTIAELAHCRLPALLIPYPYARRHQRANAQLVEAVGGGLMLEEAEATPERLLGVVRRIMTDARLRAMMGTQMHRLACADAVERLTAAIRDVAQDARTVSGA